MKVMAIIPARYASTRFPGKPLALIKGKPMIQWVYEQVSMVNSVNGVYVATDDERIYDTVTAFGGKAIMTASSHTCGTERVAECSRQLQLENEDIVLNIQGDEPTIRPEMINDLIGTFDGNDVYIATLKKKIDIKSECIDTNVVKVVTDVNDNAIYFSRYCIPFNRDDERIFYYKHIGIYGYKKWFLDKLCSLKKGTSEKAESLEQLRVLEYGFKIKVKETRYQTLGVDTPQQLKEIEKKFEKYYGKDESDG